MLGLCESFAGIAHTVAPSAFSLLMAEGERPSNALPAFLDSCVAIITVRNSQDNFRLDLPASSLQARGSISLKAILRNREVILLRPSINRIAEVHEHGLHVFVEV